MRKLCESMNESTDASNGFNTSINLLLNSAELECYTTHIATPPCCRSRPGQHSNTKPSPDIT